jgi:capsular polysaccharide biosynthesis protein
MSRKLQIIIGLVVLFVVFGFLFCLLKPKMYTATAYLQMLNDKPYFIYDEKHHIDYENFVNTHIAIIRSPLILEKVLESPDVAQLPVIKSKKDKIGWLVKKLELQRKDKSEIVTISITLPVPEDAERIVNGVIVAFFEFYDNDHQDWNLRLLTQLNLELNRQKATARLLQDEIRSGLERSAKQGGILGTTVVQGESILRDLYQHESKLETLRSELKVLRETLNDPSKLEIPTSMIQAAIENDPMSKMLLQRKIDSQEQMAELKKVTAQEDDPKIIALQQQIKEIEEKIEKNKGNTEEVKKKLQTEYVRQLEQKFFETQTAVRSQEIVTENLRQKYHEQIADIGSRTVQVVDVQFRQDQLRRVNLILDQLESRVLALETEKYAPPQILLRKKATVSTQPNHSCCWWW